MPNFARENEKELRDIAEPLSLAVIAKRDM